MMTALDLNAFAAFYAEVHGSDHSPFAWQRALLAQVVTERRWPAVIELPSGTGKTSCIDIALFALAMDDNASWCPRRIALIVDRRLAVDHAARRGERIARALHQARPGSVCHVVAERLMRLSVEGSPLRVAVLRGGIVCDAGWARSPDQPLVIASTVDQFGSRLLFRGHGVPWSMRPIHAGLTGNDTLILLDEVQRSRPFAQTLQTITKLRRHGHAARGFHVVTLSSPSSVPADTPFRMSDEALQSGLIAKRMQAQKPVRFVECDGWNHLTLFAAEEAAALLTRTQPKPHRAIAVVVNRVDSAHQIARKLRLNRAVTELADVVLITGRMRPLDRDDRVRDVEPRIGAVSGRRTRGDVKAVIVVTTQCVEVGPDFDFDAMVSEHASIDALRQRFGRLDRLGEYGRSEGLVIAVRESDEHGRGQIPPNDAAYGQGLATDWTTLQRWRGGSRTLDFGVAAIDARLGGKNEHLSLDPKARAPALFPEYLRLWAQTAPPPLVEPDVSLFLHGPTAAGLADVQLVWRRDLDDPDVWTAGENGAEPIALARVAAIPPTSLEAASVPYVVVRRWLGGEAVIDAVVDLDRGAARYESRPHRPSKLVERFVRGIVWRGHDSFVLTEDSIDDLCPGDTLVLPTRRGGLYDGSFDASGSSLITDVAERSSLLGRGLAVLRRHESVLRSLMIEVVNERPRAVAGAPAWVELMLDALEDADWINIDARLSMRQARLPSARGFPGAEFSGGGDEATTQPETSSFVGRAIKLSTHSRDVERWARDFARKLSLAPDLVETLAFAGWLHDVGKADRRFQQLLRDNSEVALVKDQVTDPDDWLLAKSEASARERRRTLAAAARCDYPVGARHEVMSLAMIQHSRAVEIEARRRGVQDMDLVFHLVASHHGWCRPLSPSVTEPDEHLAVEVQHGDLLLTAPAKHDLDRLDSPLADRFSSLGKRYGWLQLAWLESILRLADHRASEHEASHGHA